MLIKFMNLFKISIIGQRAHLILHIERKKSPCYQTVNIYKVNNYKEIEVKR